DAAATRPSAAVLRRSGLRAAMAAPGVPSLDCGNEPGPIDSIDRGAEAARTEQGDRGAEAAPTDAGGAPRRSAESRAVRLSIASNMIEAPSVLVAAAI